MSQDPILQKEEELWVKAEQRLSRGPILCEDLRTSGLLAARKRRWHAALLRLTEAAHHGMNDCQLLDSLGEAAFRTRAAVTLLPFQRLYKNPQLATHMARAFLMLGNITEAKEFLRYAEDSNLKASVGAILGIQGSIEDAIAAITKPCADEASREKIRRLDYPPYWQALASIADVAGRKDLVSFAEERTKAVDYNNPVIHYNQALRFLLQGEFAAGWRLYDWRLHPESNCALPTSCAEVPMWQGESVSGKTLLLLLEYGFGDQIFSLRFLAAAQAAGARVELAVDSAMVDLAKSSFTDVKIHLLEEAREGRAWIDQTKPDYWCYAFSLPSRLQIDRTYNTGGYLQTSQELFTNRKREIHELNPKHLPVFGIVWHGDIRTPAMRSRAYSLSEFLEQSKILQSPILLVNLQKEATESEVNQLRSAAAESGCVFINAAPTLTDFSQTASWVQNLDRLYACDTSVGHLAGALATPTTILIRNRSIWQWRGTSDGKSVWYDSIQIQYALTPTYSYMFELLPKSL